VREKEKGKRKKEKGKRKKEKETKIHKQEFPENVVAGRIVVCDQRAARQAQIVAKLASRLGLLNFNGGSGVAQSYESAREHWETASGQWW
jgi:hypothetical protein